MGSGNGTGKIIVFACHWCAYSAADLAGIRRLDYPENVRIVRVMCSGMVHPKLVIETFALGADGVLIMGCRLGECHYKDGNIRADARRLVIHEMMEAMGLERERFRMVWCASSEAETFVKACRDMAETVDALGARG